jgi:hypothetical protein
MNYIKQLEQDRLNAAKKLANIMLELEAFNVHLHSEKFKGVDSTGERKDWIATEDVILRVREIKALI